MYEYLSHYAYFFGAIAFFPIWLIIFIYRKDLRSVMIFAGVIGAALGMFDFLIWVPKYWNPPFLFDLPHKVGFSIEDIILGFLGGGIAAVFTQFATSSKLRRVARDHKTHLGALVILCVAHIGIGLLGYPLTSWVVGTSAAAVYIAYRRHDLLPQILLGGFAFMLIYFLLLNTLFTFFPLYMQTYYNLHDFIGLSVGGLPIEEFIFSFSGGMLWSVLYEYTESFKLSRPSDF